MEMFLFFALLLIGTLAWLLWSQIQSIPEIPFDEEDKRWRR